jgi:antibiotic biosynthesis monooxygenase (ABM) superfamily enzyme
MALQLGALREALLDAGASPEKASKAAEELAGYEDRFDSLDRRLTELEGKVNLLTWMVGFNIAMTLAVLWRVFAHG